MAAATGRSVEAPNLSEHTGLTLPQLLAKLESLAPRLAEADVIVVAIAHNSVELNADEPCRAPLLKKPLTICRWQPTPRRGSVRAGWFILVVQEQV